MSSASKTKSEVSNAILSYLRDAAPNEAANITADTKILDIIDSFSIVELLAFLEGQMQVEIDLAVAEPKDLATAASLAQFLVPGG
jgi:acyl carrier protein